MAIILLYKFTRTQFSGTNLAAVRKGRRLSSTMSTVKCIYDTQYISGRGSKAMTLLSAVLLRNCELSASRNCTRSSLLYNLVFLMCCEFYFELVRVCNIHKYNYAESLVCLLAVIIYRLYNQAFQIHVRSYWVWFATTMWDKSLGKLSLVRPHSSHNTFTRMATVTTPWSGAPSHDEWQLCLWSRGYWRKYMCFKLGGGNWLYSIRFEDVTSKVSIR